MRVHWPLLLCLAGLGLGATPAAATDIIVDLPELVVAQQGTNQTCAMPAAGYQELTIDDQSASLVLLGQQLPAGRRRVAGQGIRRVSWQPREGATDVLIEFARPPSYSAINAVEGTEHRHTAPRVGTVWRPQRSCRFWWSRYTRLNS